MIYNTRIKTYSKGQQVTIYSKTFEQDENTEKKNKNFTKSYQNENRSKQQEEDCKRISIKQTKNRIYDIARANEWEWFITLTFDRKKKDSSDYDTIVKSLTQFLNDLRKRKCPDLKYLIVPELHADGKKYHFHGLLANCNGLQFRYSGHNDQKSHRPIYNILNWKHGFTTATQIQDSASVSGYITKYLTKESCSVLKNKKRYYASNNVNLPNEEYIILDRDELIEEHAKHSSYIKSINIPQAFMHIDYLEFKDNEFQTDMNQKQTPDDNGTKNQF